MKSLWLLVFFGGLTCSSFLAQGTTSVDPQRVPYRLLLAGGGLATCSSMALKNCTEEGKQILATVPGKTTLLYRLSQAKLARLSQAPWWQPERAILRDDWLALLKRVYAVHGEKDWPKTAFLELLKSSEIEVNGREIVGKSLLSSLNDQEWFGSLDLLEEAQFRGGERSKEIVALSYNRNPFSVEIYQQFVQMAAQVRVAKQSLAMQKEAQTELVPPKIGVITASSRDPFEAVDFYTGVFAAAGAEAVWVPIDAAMLATRRHAAIVDGVYDCSELDNNREVLLKSFERERIYPHLIERQRVMCQQVDRVSRLLKSLDGVFFNGGDQSLTRAALVEPDGSDSEWLSIIRQQYEGGLLTVGGTSAGTAVMSGKLGEKTPPMISNGSSYQGLTGGAIAVSAPSSRCTPEQTCGDEFAGEKMLLGDSLTYHANGGLRLFPWGVLDTHFSERGRQGRLMKLAVDTDTRFGFGVDEATALQVAGPEYSADRSTVFRVIGQGGVYLIDTHDTQIIDTPKGKKLKGVISHYLTRDDTASLSTVQQLQIQFASWKKRPVEHQMVAKRLTSEDLLVADHYKKLAEAFCYSRASKANGRSYRRDPEWWLTLSKTEQTQIAVAKVDVNGEPRHWCSYQHMLVTFEPG
ncbi:hypothetical protein DU002_09815 [Corallincola holothuriorum]|uniref:Cyanophycinase n=1 Tax=Corallincola holothuriorum TaxID=2282215 RepID=A0A368NJU7_9GAMM|nr:cyanophycinase [Corallincola holothuriorum]RCU49914.1 hypothetical protein DU002_09815 [Corallincola holothuriorum]